MARWEYKFIQLYMGAPSAAEAFTKVVAEVEQAGEDGWEAVGEIAVGQRGPYDPRGNTDVTLRALMLKRPLP